MTNDIIVIQRLQSAQSAAARLIYRICRYDRITDALISLHWLRVPERISFKIAVLTYRSLNGSAPSYLSSYFTRVADVPSRHRRLWRLIWSVLADVPSRHRLRLASTSRLTTPFIRHSKRSFPVVDADLWNELPSDITSAPSLLVFRQRLKTSLFRRSYPDIVV